MKQHFWILTLTVLSSLGFHSCSNDEFKDLSYQETQAKLENDSVLIVSNLDELFDVFSIKPAEEKPPMELRKTLDVQDKIALGYTNITQSSLQRLAFAKDLADRLGLSPVIGYNCYFKTVTKIITVPAERSFYNDISPLCGFQPKTNVLFTYAERGYSVGSNTSAITLTTYLLYVDFDMYGGYVKKHYPCSPELIQWAYLLF